jgi:hypothetical protein
MLSNSVFVNKTFLKAMMLVTVFVTVSGNFVFLTLTKF